MQVFNYVASLDFFGSILQANVVCFKKTPWIVQFKKIKFALSLPHEVHFSPCFQGTVAKRAVRNLGDMVGEEVAMTVQVWQLQLGQVGWVGH